MFIDSSFSRNGPFHFCATLEMTICIRSSKYMTTCFFSSQQVSKLSHSILRQAYHLVSFQPSDIKVITCPIQPADKSKAEKNKRRGENQ